MFGCIGSSSPPQQLDRIFFSTWWSRSRHFFWSLTLPYSDIWYLMFHQLFHIWQIFNQIKKNWSLQYSYLSCSIHSLWCLKRPISTYLPISPISFSGAFFRRFLQHKATAKLVASWRSSETNFQHERWAMKSKPCGCFQKKWYPPNHPILIGFSIMNHPF